MTKLIVNTIDSRSASTEFKDIITANQAKQWLDKYGVIKGFKNSIDENVTIPSGTNGVSAGTTKISSGYTVTVQGEWRIV
tara:strand:- start:150 stop:389 length:240 start_codon:yes stop_codon:yes gene_type:complete